MDDSLKAQIQQRMQEKDTEDLVAICDHSDGEVWTDEAYAIARATLAARGVEPPDSASEYAGQAADDADEEEDEDVYHDFNRLMNVASWSSGLSWFFLGFAVIFLIPVVMTLFSILGAGANILAAGLLLVGLALLVLVSAFFFVLAQAVAQIVYLLLDIFDDGRASLAAAAPAD